MAVVEPGLFMVKLLLQSSNNGLIKSTIFMIPDEQITFEPVDVMPHRTE